MGKAWRALKRFWQAMVLPNWQTKLASLAAAIIIWSYVAGQQSMQVVFTAPIHFQNVPEGSRLKDPPLKVAEVTVSGRRDRILTVKQQQVWIALDLSGLRNGDNLYLISFQDVVVPSGIEVKDISPRQLTLELVPAR